MSYISLVTFSLSCKEFMQRQQSIVLLKEIKNNLEEIEHNLELSRDRMVKVGMEIMNDAQNCSNTNNLDFYIKSAYEKFIEAICSYDIDKSFNEYTLSIFERDIKEIITENIKMPKMLMKYMMKDSEEKVGKSSTILNYYETACLGAGICSFYLKEYSNSFKYFDKSLLVYTKLWNVNEKNNYVNLFNNHPFLRPILQMIKRNQFRDKFECFIELEKYNETVDKYPNSNLFILKKEYLEYKRNSNSISVR